MMSVKVHIFTEIYGVAMKNLQKIEKISPSDKLSLFDRPWTPKIIAELNENYVKLAKLEGEFIWHKHKDDDELFLVIEGHLSMHLRDRTIELHPGEMIVIPKGVEHKPEAASGTASVLLIEPKTVLNTGDQRDSDLTKTELEWI